MAEQENSIVQLQKYLGTEERPVSSSEMSDFWKSCTKEEKLEFKSTELE